MDKRSGKPEYSGLEIAVIGMAGRFPGARNINEFWENLKNGVESITFFSEKELNQSGLNQTIIDDPNFINAYGKLHGKDYFDSSFFGYVPEEALVMDPQMRLFHECVWEALEDAGYPPDTYDGLIGLYGGAGPGFFWEIYAAAFASDAIDSFSANQLRNRDYLCARISYKLNLKGPAVFVQTACSTGLVAVHLASRGLLTGETHIALAGGITLNSSCPSGYIYQEGMIYSSDGHTRTFDAKAKGTVGAEGAGVVVLKLLKHALADQDHIWAIIKGTAINNDGLRKVGFSAPSPDGQAEVIRMALKMSRVDPQTIGYIETHGTATPLGDVIEMEALNLVFGKGKEKRCPIGSVKTNMGHLDAAAGSASLIKAVLALKYRQIPPSLHFQTPNPNIDFSSFYVNTALQEWISDGDHPRRAGVSSFGIGGTNAHVILEEFQGLFLKKPPLDPAKTFGFGLMIFSAKSHSALDRMIGNFHHFFEKNQEIAIEDAAYALQLGRSSFPHRAFFVCKDADDARKILSAPASGKIKRFSIPKKGKPPVFMFSGQGTYYINMGLELYQSQDPCVAVFRRELDRCFELIQSENDFKAILFPEKGKEEPEALNRTSISQPLLFMFEYALASMLISWGIKPGAMIGYSTGEYTAACLAGVFSLENALKLVALRGRLVEALPTGAMLSVPLTENELLPMLKFHPELSLAVDNGSSCVVSGTPEDISAFEKEMKAQKRLCIRLNVTHAGHSRILEPIVEIYEAAVREVKPQTPSERYVSTVTGQWITDAQATDPGYWAQHIQSPVRFFKGLDVLMGEDYSMFIEIGPGKSLSNFARQHPGKKEGVLIANLVRDMNETVSDMYYLMDRLGRMWLYGQSIDWKRFYGEKKKHRMSLPTYPFEKIKYPTFANINKLLSDLNTTLGKDKFGKNETYGTVISSEGSYKAERPELVTPYVEPSTLTEKELVLMWENFFGVGKIGIIDDFFELGGDSLKAMTLSGKIHRQFDVEIQLTDFFGHPTIKDLAAFIDASTKNEFRSIPKAPKKDHYLLSAAQKRLFFIQHMAPEATAYNLPQVLMLPGVPDKDQLERIFNTLIERHESFRTSFELTDEGPVQIIHDPERIRFSIHYPDYTINPNDFNTELLRFVVPFDLSVAPLLRAAVIKTTENTWMLFTDMHHIISDGVSMTRLETEFTDLAAGRTLPPLPIQYRDFSEWQNSDAQQQKKTEKAQYWLNQFGDSVPTLELPYDFPRPPVTRFEGNTTRFGLEKEIVDRLKEIGAPSDATLYMVLMAIHFIFLSKLSGQEDIVVGIPVAGRNHPDLQPIIGMFVNTLAIRNYPVAEQTFLSFLEEVKTSALRAYENQDYPFEELVEKLTLERNTARNPVFDVVFNMLNQAEFKGELPSDHGYVHTPGVSKYDLTMYFVELEGGRGLIFNVEYGSNLFKPETINRFIGYYKHIVSQVMAQPDIELKAIDILGEEERHRIVSAFSQSGETFAIDKTLHGLFEEQAARTPDNIAVVGNFYQGAFLKNRPLDPQKTFCFLTYRQLNEQSEHLACVLRDKGINFDAIVAIKIRRSIEMIIGILGILKSGAAYLPINPNQPDARTQYMLADSGAKLLITGEGDRLEISVGADPRVCPRVSFEREMGAHMGAPLQLNKNSHIAYVIYTSGSTGNPKGVPIGHSSITALMRWARKELGLTKEDRVIQNLSFYFDWSVEEIFLPLVTGASLCIVPEEWIMQPESLIDLFHRYDITALNMGPTQLSFLLGAGKKLSTLKYLYMGVEKLNVELLERILEAVNETCRICFMYGPTEATVLCTKFEIDRSRFNIYKQQFASLPIGKPVVNNALYIMNKQLQVCPIGVTGEIYIAGDGLSGGYLNNPELTNETFIIINSPSINTQTKSFCPAFYKKRAAGGILYKTGDLAKWMEDGNIEFLGRIDHQVKIRGYRIELGEIENRLLSYEGIKDAVVIDKQDPNGEKYLCAYMIPGDGFGENSDEAFAGLRSYLAAQLPDYMIPGYILTLARIPLTPNGKLDRNALPAPQSRLTGAHVPPRDEIEETLADMWRDVLDIQTPIGIDDNFFHLGGHSLKAAVLFGKIRKTFHLDFSLLELFKNPTIRDIASAIKSVEWVKQEDTDIAETENPIQNEDEEEFII